MAWDAVYEADRLVRATGWDEYGRVNVRVAEGRLTRTIRHDDGRKAVEGDEVGGRREGVWREWDEAGALVGEVTFRGGEPVAVEVATSRLLLSDPTSLSGVSVAASEDLRLPHSATFGPPPLAVNLVVSRREIVVDGVPVLSLEAARVPDDARRGMMVTRLYDRLLEKREVSQALHTASGGHLPADVGALILQADRGARYEDLLPVLYTAAQAQFGVYHVLTLDETLRWPPRTGLERLRGGHPMGAVTFSLPAIRHGAPAEPLWIVSIGDDGFSIRGEGALEAELADLEELGAHAGRLKTIAPARDTLALAPSPETTLQAIVAAAEALRGEDGARFSTLWLLSGQR